MKALSALVSSGASVPAIANGRVTSRHSRPTSDSENAEIQMYLSKLKDLVPFMPKNRKLSKLEVIQYVIDYICDLQTALETHPAAQSPSPFEDYLNNNDVASANNNTTNSSSKQSQRQPLGIRQSPNQILEAVQSTAASNHSSSSMTDLLFLQQLLNNVSVIFHPKRIPIL